MNRMFWLLLLFGRPLYRVDILKFAKENKKSCLCSTIGKALSNFKIYYRAEQIFPLFRIENAKQFNATQWAYWWQQYIWNTGREDFLDWLIEQYKDDKEDLRKYRN